MRCTTKTFLRLALAAMAMALGVSIVAGCTSSDLNGAAPAAQSEQPVTAPRRQYTREDAAIQRAVDDAHAKYRDLKEGKNADYIPALAKVDSNLFGIAVVTTDGRVFTAGDATHEFSVQSISKVFTLALVMSEIGPQTVSEKIGVEPTGLPFNSVLAIEIEPGRPSNSFVNAGAIATTSLVKARDANERWQRILSYLGKFAGRDLKLIDEVYQSEAATNQHNQGIAVLLKSYDRMYCDPLEATDVYTKQCSVGVSAKDLAVMGATLANGGENPLTHERLMKSQDVPELLAVMTMAGFYDESGKWAYEVGLPAKTGVGGGIVAVVPGRMAIAAFAPPLNKAGNSVRAQKAIADIARQFNADIFAAPISSQAN
jgi:glutaminase